MATGLLKVKISSIEVFAKKVLFTSLCLHGYRHQNFASTFTFLSGICLGEYFMFSEDVKYDLACEICIARASSPPLNAVLCLGICMYGL